MSLPGDDGEPLGDGGPRYESFSYTVSEGCAEIRLGRPEKRNSLIRSFWRDLPLALLRAVRDPGARCVLISAEGPHFSSGIDLSLLESIGRQGASLEDTRRRELLRHTILSLQESLTALERCPLPVIVAVQSGCIGGALDLVCAADIRLVEQGTRFIAKEMDLGFIPDLGTVQRLAIAVPPAVASDWLMSARPVSGEEALRFGFASRMADSVESLQAVAREITRTLAAKSPLAIRGAKEMLRFTRAHGVDASLAYTAAWQSFALFGDDLEESLEAAAQKRAAAYAPLADEIAVAGMHDLSLNP